MDIEFASWNVDSPLSGLALDPLFFWSMFGDVLDWVARVDGTVYRTWEID